MIKQLAIAAISGIILLTGPSVAAPDYPDTIQLEDVLDWETVGNAQISPDGEQILYTRTRIDKMNDRRSSTMWLVNADGSKNRQLRRGSGGLWSPDGSRIAYYGRDNNDKTQIFVRYMDAEGLVTQVTSFEHAPRSMAWSPDGQSIAFVARIPSDPDWAVKLPGKPKGAKWTSDPVVIDTLHYRQDRVGFTNGGFDHLFVVPSIGGTPKQLTEGKWNVGQRGIGVIAGSPQLSWSPDSQLIAFDGPGHEIRPPHWFESHINIVNAKTGEMRQLTTGTGIYGSPSFSPSGRTIAFTGYPEHNTAYPVPDLYTVRVSNGEIDQLTDDLPDGPGTPYWSADTRDIYFTMEKHGSRNIWAVSSSGGEPRQVTDGRQVISLHSMSDDGRAGIVWTTPEKPARVAIARNLKRSTSLRPLTNVNDDVLAGKKIGAVEEFWYDSTADTGETARVQGWIITPPDFDPSKKYPLILNIHGGPHAMYNTGFNLTFQEFAARGYVILYTNPRGSTGYGSEFANAIRHRYPGPVDYADLINGVDEVISRGYVDEDRLFVTGCSGGGVLTTWVIAQTDRFKAAAALCPVVNWIGMSGTTDVVGWLYNFFPAPFWEDPQPWLDHSTIMHVGKVNTPTLLITGDRDLRTPLGEAEEYYAALKIRGVPTKLIPMRGEYHGTRSRPSNYLRTSLMLRKWFDEFDPAKQDDKEKGDAE